MSLAKHKATNVENSENIPETILFELLHLSVVQQKVSAPVPKSDPVLEATQVLEQPLVIDCTPRTEATYF